MNGTEICSIPFEVTPLSQESRSTMVQCTCTSDTLITKSDSGVLNSIRIMYVHC